MTSVLPVFTYDPFPMYAKLRERGHVHRREPDRLWVVCGHAEVESVLRNPQIFSSEIGNRFEERGGGVGQSMIMKDPPEHTFLRNIVSKAFTPRTIVELEPRIREITVELLDQIEPGETYDIVERFAIPLPITVIAEMLGVDPADRADFKRWSNAITGVAPMGSEKLREEFGEYFGRAIEERRREPTDDLISRLVQASDVGGRTLTVDELLSFIMLLLVAGNETTTNLIGLATFYLARYPDQRELLVDEPSRIANAVEEVLRFDGPVHGVPPRIAKQDTSIGDVEVGKGEWVMPALGAANRDATRFEDAEAFDVGRRDASAHVTFGAGIHFCLGAPLARLEGRVAFEELLARTPGYRIASPESPVQVADNMILRTITSLPIVA